MIKIRESMHDLTICKTCKYALDVNQTECKKHKQGTVKMHGYMIVKSCGGFDEIEDMEND